MNDSEDRENQEQCEREKRREEEHAGQSLDMYEAQKQQVNNRIENLKESMRQHKEKAESEHNKAEATASQADTNSVPRKDTVNSGEFTREETDHKMAAEREEKLAHEDEQEIAEKEKEKQQIEEKRQQEREHMQQRRSGRDIGRPL